MGDIATDDEDLKFVMDERAIEAHISGLFDENMDKAHEVYENDAVLLQPQFGVTVAGRENIKAERRKQGRTLIKVNSVLGQDDLWIAESTFKERSKALIVVNIMEFRDGQIVREKEYLCNLG